MDFFKSHVLKLSVAAVLAFSASPALTFAQGKTSAGITLDFEDVELRNLIRFMAETTDKNFIVDNKVNGKVTVISPKPVNEQKAFEIFENLLIASGFAIVPAGDGAYRIVSAAEAPKHALEISGQTQGQVYSSGQMVTRILEPSYVNVSGILPIVKPLLSSQANMGAYVSGNKLIITENYGNLQRIERLVKRLDNPIGEHANVQMIKVSNADVTQVSEVLSRIFGARKADKDSQKVEVIADVASNRLIVVANRADMMEAKRLVEQLDNNADQQVRSLDIVYLRHADAKDLEGVLNDIVEKSIAAKDEKNTDKASTIIKSGSFKGNVSIVADESTNSLVLSAQPADMVTIKNVIESLDVRRLQVYIEALIMEVSSDVTNQFGVEWRSTDPSGSGLNAFGGQSFNGGLNALSENPLAMPQGFTFGLAGANISYRGEEFANIGFLVNALQADSNVNILSTPQLMTMDNQEAEIIVGDNVPFVTGSYSNDSGGGNPFQTIERQDIGLTLRIKPQISENGFIRLNIYQEISSIGNQGQAADLVTRKRSLKTNVVVSDRNMVALGGLMRDDTNEVHQQVPCLANIFGFGEIFKNNSVQNTKTNLMVFIKPTIINAFGDAETITNKKYLDMRKLQLERTDTDKGNFLVPVHDVPEADMVPEKFKYSRDQYEADKEVKENDETSSLTPVQTPAAELSSEKVANVISSEDPMVAKKKEALRAFLGFETDEQLNAYLAEMGDIQPAAGPVKEIQKQEVVPVKAEMIQEVSASPLPMVQEPAKKAIEEELYMIESSSAGTQFNEGL